MKCVLVGWRIGRPDPNGNGMGRRLGHLHDRRRLGCVILLIFRAQLNDPWNYGRQMAKVMVKMLE